MTAATSTRARIPLSEPCLTGNARRYLEECLATNFVSSVGPFVDRFERAFAERVGSRHAVACASGTAALHLAFRVLGVEPGDEVWAPTFTFVASVNPALYQGAKLVLVDSETTTWNMDPSLVIDELEHRARRGCPLPKVIEVVHALGHPADVAPLARVCDELSIALVEDAAEALGASYLAGPAAGRQVGTVGRIGCFSFNGNKIITSGGGGMLVTDDAELARRARHLSTQARLPGRAYQHDEVGYNYRLSNLAAALGLAQLEQLDGFLSRKRALAARYHQALADHAALVRAPSAAWAEPSFWLYSAQLTGAADAGARDAVLDALDAAGIEARPVWTPLHRIPLYREAGRLGDGTVAEQVADRAFSLPSSVTLSEREQDRVIEALMAAVGGARGGAAA